MGTLATDRKVSALYAALTPVERARLLARAWREHTGEIPSIRDAIPDAAAGAAYNRAVGILRGLHGSPVPALFAVKLGLEKGILLAVIAHDQAATRRNVRAYVHRLWRLLAYPVTATEHRQLVELERAEPVEVEEALGFSCFERHPEAPGLRPELAALMRERRDDMTEEEEDRLWRRFLGCFRAAVKRGDLPKPTRRDGGLWLPAGVLSDWAEGTTPATYEPFGPDYHIPEVELFGGGLAAWDIRPDAEAETVRARRAEMLAVFGSIVRDEGDLDAAVVAGLSLEPPATLEEQRQRRDALLAVWPWGTDEGVWEMLRQTAVGLQSFRTELRVYREVIAQIQEAEFGGEDPLDPTVRELLGRAEEIDAKVVRLWGLVTETLKPFRQDGGDWPPSLDDDAQYAELRPKIEAQLRGEWDD